MLFEHGPSHSVTGGFETGPKTLSSPGLLAKSLLNPSADNTGPSKPQCRHHLGLKSQQPVPQIGLYTSCFRRTPWDSSRHTLIFCSLRPTICIHQARPIKLSLTHGAHVVAVALKQRGFHTWLSRNISCSYGKVQLVTIVLFIFCHRHRPIVSSCRTSLAFPLTVKLNRLGARHQCKAWPRLWRA